MREGSDDGDRSLRTLRNRDVTVSLYTNHDKIITALFTNMRILKFKSQLTITFSLPSTILTDLLGNKTLLERVQKVICDWWISIRFVSFFVSRFVASDRNYDWRQRKTQLWRRLLNVRIRKFVKSAVNCNIYTNRDCRKLRFNRSPFVLSRNRGGEMAIQHLSSG